MAGATVGQVFMDSLSTVGLISSAVSGGFSTAKTAGSTGATQTKELMSHVYNSKMGRLARTGTKFGITSMKMANQVSSAMAGSMLKVATNVTGIPKLAKGILSKGLGLIGINIGVSALLRQSQLFTGTIGALFQILGGFVDVILAPFMPLFAKVIAMLGSKIPWVAEWAQKIYAWLEGNVFPIIKNLFGNVIGKFAGIKDWLGVKFAEAKVLWDILTANFDIEKIQQWFIDNVWAKAEPVLDFIWKEVVKTYNWLKDDILPILNDIWDWIVPAVEDVYNWLVDDMFPIFSNLYDEIRDFYTNFLKTTFDTLSQLWDIAWPVVKPIITSLGTTITELMDWVNEELFPFINKIIDTFMPHVEDVVTTIKDTVMPILNEFMDQIFNPLWDAIKPWLNVILWVLDKAILPVAKFLLGVVGKLIVNVIWPMIKFAVDVLTFILKAPFWLWEKVVKPGIGWLKTGWDWLLDFLKRTWHNARILFANIWDAIEPMGTPGADKLRRDAENAILRMDANSYGPKDPGFQAQEVDVNIHFTGEQVSEHDKYMSKESNLARTIGLSSFTTSGMTLNPVSPGGGYIDYS